MRPSARVAAPLTALTILTIAPAWSAVAQPPDAASPPPATTVVWLHHDGWAAMMPSPKDAGLRRALDMLPARLRELPDDLPAEGGEGPRLPPAAAELLGRLLVAGSPLRVALEYNPENQGGFMGAGLLVASVRAAEADARRDHDLARGLLADSPLRPRDAGGGAAFKGMSEVLTPLGLVRFGPRQMGDTWSYQVRAGTVSAAAESTPDFGPAEPGLVPHTRLRFDAAPLAPFLDFAAVLAASDPGAAAMIERLRSSGLVGADGHPALSISMIAGTTPDRAVSITTIHHAASLSAATGGFGLSRTPLTDADFRAVPADAHWAYLGRLDPAPLVRLLRDAADNPDAGQGLAKFREATGVDLLSDVIQQFAGGYALYIADSTGGGGLFSLAGVLSLRDGKRLDTALERIATLATAELAKPHAARGHAAARRWTDPRAPGCTFTSIAFPGLPIPLEITAGVTADRLILALSPVGAIAAARQAGATTGRGVLDNPRFADALGAGREHAVACSFSETTRTLREGYPLVMMLGSALSNLVRSKAGADPSRDPGVVIPTFAELAEGARCSVRWSTWRGDDYVIRAEGDRSAMVRLADTAGKVAPFMPVLTLAGAAAAIEDQKKKLGAGQPHPDADRDDAD